jgi:dephospho-CoA kinase
MPDPFREPVSLSDPDPAWRRQYVAEAARISAALTTVAPTIEHIGSTSIPLRGKPIIDIQVAVEESHRARHRGTGRPWLPPSR